MSDIYDKMLEIGVEISKPFSIKQTAKLKLKTLSHRGWRIADPCAAGSRYKYSCRNVDCNDCTGGIKRPATLEEILSGKAVKK